MEATLTPGTPPTVGMPEPLFVAPVKVITGADRGRLWTWDVTPDGQRFLINPEADHGADSPPLTVITNWLSTLKKPR
jgi:hypothetical protein